MGSFSVCFFFYNGIFSLLSVFNKPFSARLFMSVNSGVRIPSPSMFLSVEIYGYTYRLLSCQHPAQAVVDFKKENDEHMTVISCIKFCHDKKTTFAALGVSKYFV